VDSGVEYQGLVLNHLDSLYNYALVLTRRSQDAEDLLQDVLVRGFQGFGGYDRSLSFKGYSMSEEERWAISYYVLSLSAWIDPHTGKRLEIPAGPRASLNSSAVDAGHPSLAVDPADPAHVAADSRGKGRKLYPGIRE